MKKNREIQPRESRQTEKNLDPKEVGDKLFKVYWQSTIKYPQGINGMARGLETTFAAMQAGVDLTSFFDRSTESKYTGLSQEQLDFTMKQMDKVHGTHNVDLEKYPSESRIIRLHDGNIRRMRRVVESVTELLGSSNVVDLSKVRNQYYPDTDDNPFHLKHLTADERTIINQKIGEVVTKLHEILNASDTIDLANAYRKAIKNRGLGRKVSAEEQTAIKAFNDHVVNQICTYVVEEFGIEKNEYGARRLLGKDI